ncbi:MAG TPA: FecR domain-containing protein [Nitrospira sp.]
MWRMLAPITVCTWSLAISVQVFGGEPAPAILSVLAGEVTIIPPEGGVGKPASNGMTVAVGTRVQTGKKSTALITFVDGSTLTVQPESDVTIKQADIGKQRSRVTVGVNVGTVWARVVKLVDPESSFSLQSNTATATVHDGLIGARQEPDNTFSCWTRAGDLWVLEPSGRARAILKPGQTDIVKAGTPSNPKAFFSNHSALRIETPLSVLPVILMPDRARIAGFTGPETEVNQVFGSYTGMDGEGHRVVEVPAGVSGPFILILEGEQDGPFLISIGALYKGMPVDQHQVSGTLQRGARLAAQLTQRLEGVTNDEKTAKVSGVTIGPLESTDLQLPGKVGVPQNP